MKKDVELLSRVGDLSQVMGAKEYMMMDGKSKGVRTLEVRNGGGLEFTVVEDRCLDLCDVRFKGVNMSYMSKTGIVNPLYNSDGKNFFRVFTAGFLTTCGLRNVGDPCTDGGEEFGIHGRIGSLPAEEISHETIWNNGKPEVVIKGNVREAAFFGENLKLHREIRCVYGENVIHLQNEVENMGFRDERLMLLLHFNIGFPFLDKGTRFLSSSKEVEPRDAEAAVGIKDYHVMHEPVKDYPEQVFYHELKTDQNGNTKVGFVNDQLQMGISLTFSRAQFPNFTQWKQMGQGEYVAAMEPCNCFVGGRNDLRNKEIQCILSPFEKKRFDIDIRFYAGTEELLQLEDSIKCL